MGALYILFMYACMYVCVKTARVFTSSTTLSQQVSLQTRGLSNRWSNSNKYKNNNTSSISLYECCSWSHVVSVHLKPALSNFRLSLTTVCDDVFTSIHYQAAKKMTNIAASDNRLRNHGLCLAVLDLQGTLEGLAPLVLQQAPLDIEKKGGRGPGLVPFVLYFTWLQGLEGFIIQSAPTDKKIKMFPQVLGSCIASTVRVPFVIFL